MRCCCRSSAVSWPRLSSLDLRKGSATPVVSLHKKGEQWTVAQRADYPADVSKLRKLLLSLSDAKIVEEKTSDPANYATIGVDDPSKPGALGAQVDFTLNDGPQSLIVGKPSGESNFVRRSSEKTSYLVAPGIYVESEPRLWIDTKLIEIASDNIDRIEYKPLTGTPYSVHRVVPPAPAAPAPAAASAPAASAPAASAAAAPAPAPAAAAAPPEYVLDGAPAGRKPADSPTLAPSPGVFSNVTADDVAQAADLDFSKPASTVLTMKDGSTITLTAHCDRRQALDPDQCAEGCGANGPSFGPRVSSSRATATMGCSDPWSSCSCRRPPRLTRPSSRNRCR